MITSPRTFGIELEMGAKDYNNIQTLRSKLGRSWRFDDDGSIRNVVPNPIEVVSPILKGETGEQAVRQTCQTLKELDFDATHLACGFHVHLGAEEFKTKDATIVLAEKEFRDFIASKQNQKDIIQVAFVNTDAVVKYHNLKSDKPLTKRYVELGEQVFGSGMGEVRRNISYLFMNSRILVDIGGQPTKAKLFSVVTRKDVDDVYNETSLKHNKIDTEISAHIKKQPDEDSIEYQGWYTEYKRIDLKRSVVLTEEKNKVEKLQAKKEGKYVVRVKDKRNTQNLINLFLFYLVFDDVFMGMLPRSRRENNSYCMPLSTTFTTKEVLGCKSQQDFESLWYKERDKRMIDRHKGEHYDNSRYHNVNFHSLFNRHGTVEIRSHGSTINPNKILLWTALHQRVLDYVGSGKINREVLEKFAKTELTLDEMAVTMIKMLELPYNLEKYVRRLLSYFSNANL